jgi:hypothetical protein
MSTAMAELLEWVPVTQRLPDDDQLVLLWVLRPDCTDWTVGFHDADDWREA